MKRACGFSLIELVIVVVIIAIIAAIAIPRVGRAVAGTKDAALRADLKILRDAITLYSAEHGALPGADSTSPTFWRQLRKMTDVAGNQGTTPGVHIFGPYLKTRVGVPVGPNAGAHAIRFSSTSPPTVDGSNTNRGWAYNKDTGEVVANTDDVDDSGVPYNTY